MFFKNHIILKIIAYSLEINNVILFNENNFVDKFVLLLADSPMLFS